MSVLPYLSSPGNIARALNGIKAAAVPTKVNQDFVKTILKITGSSGDQMTSFLKKINFASVDGAPTEIYIKFRNPASSGSAVASAMRYGYSALYRRNEFAHALDDKGLLGLVVEETGQPHDAQAVKLSVSSFKNLRAFASFDEVGSSPTEPNVQQVEEYLGRKPRDEPTPPRSGFGLNLGYTINVNLPATTDQAVFNAIFRAIKENLLSEDDG